MPNPGLYVNCPTCGRRLVYVRTEGDAYVYWCLRDGEIALPILQ